MLKLEQNNEVDIQSLKKFVRDKVLRSSILSELILKEKINRTYSEFHRKMKIWRTLFDLKQGK